MRIGRLIKNLQLIEEKYGDIEVNIQEEPDDPKDPNEWIVAHETILAIPEERYDPEDNKEVVCNLRWWSFY